MRTDDLRGWTQACDVLVVGQGGAGACAAIEAAGSGADTLVLERMSRGGGTTAVSTGILYFGGGTRVQKACGFDDPPEEMAKFVRLAAGARADEEKVRLFCERSVEHFEWLCGHGVRFTETWVAEKTTHPPDDRCLYYSGNELAHPFAAAARPAPRGHKPAGEGGALMECLLGACQAAGVRVANDCLALRLVQDAAGRVVGVEARRRGESWSVKARRGVVLCAGGFALNDAMLARHAPELLRCNWKAATPGDDGRGIRMGAGAGGAAVNMHEGLVLNAYYPPASILKGILVNAQGQRFVNEDAYLGRTSDAILYRAGGRAWLIVDDEIHGRTQAGHRIAAVEEGFAALERALGMPEGALVHSLEIYNRHAARGEDPLFHKAAEYLRPLSTPPFAALDCCVEGSTFGVLTLGGLATRATGEVLDAEDRPVPGLYAAGRSSAGLPLEGRTYASGMSIADATFFGRLAGRSAAAAAPWEESG